MLNDCSSYIYSGSVASTSYSQRPNTMGQIFRMLMMSVTLIIGVNCSAQDTLYYTNGNRIAGQVEEIGAEQIRYRTNSGSNSVVVVAEKRELEKVRLQNGQEFVYMARMDALTTPQEFNGRKNILSFDMVSPALSHVVMGYERVVGKHSSVQVKLGYIGLYNSNINISLWNSTGGMGKVGIKFFLPPSQSRIHPPKEYHPLVGWYLKPELSISAWSSSYDRYYYDPFYTTDMTRVTENHTSVALHVMVGRQVLLGNRVTFDIFGGAGYGVRWTNGQLSNDLNSDNALYSFSHTFLDRTVPFSLSGGMMFGVLF